MSEANHLSSTMLWGANQSVIPLEASSLKICAIIAENKQAVLRCPNGNYDFNDVTLLCLFSFAFCLSLSSSISLSLSHSQSVALYLSPFHYCRPSCACSSQFVCCACLDIFMHVLTCLCRTGVSSQCHKRIHRFTSTKRHAPTSKRPHKNARWVIAAAMFGLGPPLLLRTFSVWVYECVCVRFGFYIHLLLSLCLCHLNGQHRDQLRCSDADDGVAASR